MPPTNKSTLLDSLLRVIAASFGGFAPQFTLIPKWESGRVSTSKFAVTLWPFSSHRHRRSARLRRCQARRTSLPRLKAIEAWTDVQIGGAGARFGHAAGQGQWAPFQWRGCLLAPSARHSPLLKGGGRSGAGLGGSPRRRSARLVRPDHDRQARRSYATAVNEMSAVRWRSHYRH